MKIQQWLGEQKQIETRRNTKKRLNYEPYIHFCKTLHISSRIKLDLDSLADFCDCYGAIAHNLAILFRNNVK